MQDRYSKCWGSMRRRRWIAFASLACMGLYGLLWAAHVIRFDRHKLLQPYVLPLAIPLLVFVGCFESMRCPRCGNKFCVGARRMEFWKNLFSSRCVHCGLVRGSSD